MRACLGAEANTAWPPSDSCRPGRQSAAARFVPAAETANSRGALHTAAFRPARQGPGFAGELQSDRLSSSPRPSAFPLLSRRHRRLSRSNGGDQQCQHLRQYQRSHLAAERIVATLSSVHFCHLQYDPIGLGAKQPVIENSQTPLSLAGRSDASSNGQMHERSAGNAEQKLARTTTTVRRLTTRKIAAKINSGEQDLECCPP